MSTEHRHFLNEYQCYFCGGKLAKIENITTAFSVQLGLKSGDNRLAKRPGYNTILKHHVRCLRCGLIICRSCLTQSKINHKWHNWPYCPKCRSKMVYV